MINSQGICLQILSIFYFDLFIFFPDFELFTKSTFCMLILVVVNLDASMVSMYNVC